MNLETELRNALRRKSPPAGFAERVMRAAAVQSGGKPPRSKPRWRAVAAAVALTAIVGGWAARSAAERREGERARDELLLAMRITSAKLQTAQNHVVK